MGRVATYVLDLVDEILDERSEREVRFPWAVGDLSAKTGRCVQLPFDAVWHARRLIVEVDETQHRESVPFFDKPDKLTVSGVHRGEQRAIYDRRKRVAARSAGYVVLELAWERRPPPERRDRDADRRSLTRALQDVGVLR